MVDKRIYKPLEEFSDKEINEILKRNNTDELITLPLAVSENHVNWKYAQDLCVKLSFHKNAAIRANAVLGFAYIARTKRKLEKHIVKPIVLKELKENDEYTCRVVDAIEDINLFMNWKIGPKSLK